MEEDLLEFNDIIFLKSYLGVPSASRYIAANHWVNILNSTTDNKVKKTAIIKIFEELMASAEDLGMFYFAIKKLALIPNGVYKFLYKMNLKNNYDSEWLNDIKTIRDPDSFLSILKLPAANSLATSFNTSEKNILEMISLIIENLRAAAHNRTVKDRLLVKIFNKIKHGALFFEDDKEIYVIFIDDKRSKKLRIDSSEAKNMTETIRAMRSALVGIITLLLWLIGQSIREGKLKIDPKKAKLYLKQIKTSV